MKQKLAWKFICAPAFPVLICLGLVAVPPVAAQKLKVEDVVAKHLAAIGSAERRAQVKSRLADGTVEVKFRLGGQGGLSGKGQLLSEDRKLKMLFTFASADYPGERIAFNGEKVEVGQAQPGQRTSLSNFLFAYDAIAREGLLGGVLSTSWPLPDLGARQAKLEYSGMKKVEGRQLHELKYRSRKSPADLQISLYFEPETFRHVRTQYRLVRSAGMASDPTLSSSREDTVYIFTEAFENFKEVDGLTLPLVTRLDLTIEAQNATVMTHWDFTVTSITHNPKLEAKDFAIR